MSEMTLSTIVARTLTRLGCTTLEVRLRFVHKQPAGYRVTVLAPDGAVAAMLATLIEAVGGEIEGAPAGLAGGRPLPDGPVVAFWLPVEAGVFEIPGMASG